MFGSDICTCRPYLIYGIEEAVKEAQKGGSGGEYNRFHFTLPMSSSAWIFRILYPFGTWDIIWILKSVRFLIISVLHLSTKASRRLLTLLCSSR